jgi:hypothetical protein
LTSVNDSVPETASGVFEFVVPGISVKACGEPASGDSAGGWFNVSVSLNVPSEN